MNSFRTLFKKMGRSNNQGQLHLRPRIMHAGRDWLIGLLLFVIVVGGGSAVSGLMFMRYNNITVNDQYIEVAVPRYNQNLIDDVLTIYTERQEVYRTLREGAQSSATTTDVQDGDSEDGVVATTTDAEIGVAEDVPEEPGLESDELNSVILFE